MKLYDSVSGSDLQNLTESWEIPVAGPSSYKKFLQRLICLDPRSECYENRCASCPSKKLLEEKLINAFNDNSVESIDYKQWVSTDR